VYKRPIKFKISTLKTHHKKNMTKNKIKNPTCAFFTQISYNAVPIAISSTHIERSFLGLQKAGTYTVELKAARKK
jgi:hypothetical protein